MGEAAEYRYRLTLEVTDHGERSFTASQGCEDQGEMADRLAFDIGRMLGILNSPPDAHGLVNALEDTSSVIGLVSHLFEHLWDGTRPFEGAVSLVVDLDKLMPYAEDEEKAEARCHLRKEWAKEVRSPVAESP